MTQYNSISKLIKELFTRTKNTISSNLIEFLILNLYLTILLIVYITSSQWVNLHLEIYNFSISMIILRLSIFCFWLGVAIGWIKILFHYIDNKKINIIKLFQYFHLLPHILVFITILYLIWLLPITYIIYKFPYDINLYGTNLFLYLQAVQTDLFNMLNNEISKNLFSAYFNEFDMLIITLLGIIYYTFLIKYWTIILFIIDMEISIKASFSLGSKLQKKIIPLLCITIISTTILIVISMLQNIIFLCIVFLTLQIFWLHYFRVLRK